MDGGVWRARAAALLAAVIWVAISVSVALPEQTFTLDLPKLAIDFLRGRHQMVLIFLWGIDVALAIFVLNEERMARGMHGRMRGGLCVAFACLYMIAAFFVPEFNPSLVQERPALFTALCLAIVVIVRFISYSAPRVAKPVGASATPAD